MPRGPEASAAPRHRRVSRIRPKQLCHGRRLRPVVRWRKETLKGRACRGRNTPHEFASRMMATLPSHGHMGLTCDAGLRLTCDLLH